MIDENDKRIIRGMIDAAVKKAVDFSTRKLGDTPTDVLQLTPKGYVDNLSSLTIASSGTSFTIGGVIFDHSSNAGNTGTSETDLYSDTMPASLLGNNGDKLEAEYGGVFVSSGTATREIKIYFGGTVVFDTGALTLSLSSAWTAYLTLTRVSNTTVRAVVSFTTEGAALAAYTQYTEVTSLDLTTAKILKITGQAAGVGAATNDIVAKLSAIYYFPAA